MMQPKDYSSFGCIIINLLILPPIYRTIAICTNKYNNFWRYIYYIFLQKVSSKEIYIHNKKFFISVLSIYLPDFIIFAIT